jgi:hypothetical protein
MQLTDIKAISKPTKFLDAIEMGSQTCIGVIDKHFPLSSGNCFSLRTGKKGYKVLNFNAENFEELFKKKKLSWPVKIIDVGDGCCFIHDDRIPGNWYQERICRVCAPYRLQSIPEQLKRWRDLASGRRVEKNGMISEKIECEQRALKVKWSLEAQEDLKSVDEPILMGFKGAAPKKAPGYVFAPYKPGSKILVPEGAVDIGKIPEVRAAITNEINSEIVKNIKSTIKMKEGKQKRGGVNERPTKPKPKLPPPPQGKRK